MRPTYGAASGCFTSAAPLGAALGADFLADGLAEDYLAEALPPLAGVASFLALPLGAESDFFAGLAAAFFTDAAFLFTAAPYAGAA